MQIEMSPTLRTVLTLDAVVSGAAGAGLVAGSFILAGFLGLPQELMFWAGLALLMAGRGRTTTRTIIYAIVAVNLAWAAASLYVAFGGVVAPTIFGQVFVTAQAVVVALFAELQVLGLKRSRAAA